MNNEAPDNNIRAINLKIYTGLAALLLGVFAVATVASTINHAIDELPASTTAGLATSIPVTLTAMCGFSAMGAIGAAAFMVAWQRPRQISTRVNHDDYEPPTVIAAPRPARQIEPIKRPAILPPPIDVAPVFAAWRGDMAMSNERALLRQFEQRQPPPEQVETEGVATAFTNEPALAPTMPQKITARLGQGGDEVTITLAAWQAFISLVLPTRDTWREQLRMMGASAPNSDYSSCKKIATAYSALTNAGAWVSDEARDNLTSWLCPSPIANDG